MAMSIPPGLKPVTQYVRRAERLDKAPEPEAPVVAYHCRMYATEQAMKLQDNSEAGKAFIMSMIGRLEEDKKKGMAQFSREEGQKMTMEWAMREFNAADEEDRAGLADQGTARTFYAAGVFFDVLRQFGAPDEEMDRRRIYCKWKASQILKALKEGKIPTPGGAGEDVVTGMPSGNDAAAPAPAPEATEIPSSSGGGGGGGSFGGGGYGGGTDESKQNDPLAGLIPEAPKDNPFLSPSPTHEEEAAAAAVDATPPASSPYHQPQPYGGGGGPGPEAAAAAGYPGVAAPSPYARPGPPAPEPAPYVAPVAPAPSPYAAPAPAPAAPRPRYDPSTRPRTPVPSPAGPRRSGSGGGRVMEGNMADAMEHCKFALRALEKKDVDLAVQKLHEALQQLT
ncbi:unnamed protein product [Ectocarpus sp. CCAP 1310/34]|nr:unnamed protein product [Ectocarpus sp. CCAP 1310/34]